MGAGCIAAAGTLGILIPPSIMLVVLGPIMGLPITDLFAAAILPGLLLAGIYVAYSLIKCAIRPQYGPPLPKEERAASMALVLKELLIGAVPLAILIFSTLGSILCGFATPTEASACGAFGALVLVIVYRKFTWKGLAKALHSTILLSSMILIMIASCNFFGSVFSRLGGAVAFQHPCWVDILCSFSISDHGHHLLHGLGHGVGAYRAYSGAAAYPRGGSHAVRQALVLPGGGRDPADILAFAACGPFTLLPSKQPLHWPLNDIYKGMFQYIGCQLVGHPDHSVSLP